MADNNLLASQPLIAAFLAGILAQLIKFLLNYFRYRAWNWTLLLRTGGMPSSHSAMVAGVAHSLGLNVGFGSPVFALALVLAAIVIYDATGIRRQAGRHAAIINRMITDLALGHPLKQELLLEVLGHTPMEAFVGMMMGILIAQIIFWLW